MFRFVAALVAAFFMFAAPAIAEKPCVSPETVATKAMSGMPAQMQREMSVRNLPAHLVGGFVEILNNTPPKSNIKADAILMMAHPMARGIYVIMSVKGCVTDAGGLPAPVVRAILARVQNASI